MIWKGERDTSLYVIGSLSDSLSGSVMDNAKSEFSGASPVSLTPANTCFAGVNDTGEYFFAGVVDTGQAL
jgi:hypothetical protein